MRGGDPIQPWWHIGHLRVQRWQHSGKAPWDTLTIDLGTLPDGRWFVERFGQHTRSWAYPDETSARAAVADIMAERDGRWAEAPANVSPDSAFRP